MRREVGDTLRIRVGVDLRGVKRSVDRQLMVVENICLLKSSYIF